jgi:hypothetical protein
MGKVQGIEWEILHLPLWRTGFHWSMTREFTPQDGSVRTPQFLLLARLLS